MLLHFCIACYSKQQTVCSLFSIYQYILQPKIQTGSIMQGDLGSAVALTAALEAFCLSSSRWKRKRNRQITLTWWQHLQWQFLDRVLWGGFSSGCLSMWSCGGEHGKSVMRRRMTEWQLEGILWLYAGMTFTNSWIIGAQDDHDISTMISTYWIWPRLRIARLSC